MSYATKYRLSFTDTFGTLWIADIQKKDYSGAVTTLIGTKDPINYSMPASERDKFLAIRGTTVTIGFFNMTFGQHADEFANADRFSLKLVLYKGTGNVWWSGFYDSDEYSENWQYGPNAVTVQFSCGLGWLKGKKVISDISSVYFQETNLLLLIWKILKLTGHELNLYDSNDIYELSHDRDKSVFDQLYVNDASFAELNYYELLESIIKPFGRIILINGAWHIIGHNKDVASYNAKLYNYTDEGYEFNSEVLQNNYITLTGATGTPLHCFINKSAQITFQNPIQNLSIVHDYGNEKNIFKNPNIISYHKWNVYGFNYDEEHPYYKTWVTEWDKTGYKFDRPTLKWHKAYPYNKYTLGRSICQDIKITSTRYEYLKLSLKVMQVDSITIIPYKIRWIPKGEVGKILKDDGTWGTGVSEMYFKTSMNGKLPPMSIVTQTVTKEIPPLPYSLTGENTGTLRIEIYNPATDQFFPETSPTGDIFFLEAELNLVAYDINGINLPSENKHTELVYESNKKDYEFEIRYGDASDYINSMLLQQNIFLKLNGLLYEKTTEWSIDGINYQSFIKIIRDKIVSQYNKSHWMLSGSIMGDFDPLARVIGPNRIFMFNEVEYSCKYNVYSVNLLQIAETENYLLLEDGEIIETEDGNLLTQE